MCNRMELCAGIAKQRHAPSFSHPFAQGSLCPPLCWFFPVWQTLFPIHWDSAKPSVCVWRTSCASRSSGQRGPVSVVAFIRLVISLITRSAWWLSSKCLPGSVWYFSDGHSSAVVDGMCEVVTEIVFKGSLMIVKLSDPLPNIWLFKWTSSIILC